MLKYALLLCSALFCANTVAAGKATVSVIHTGEDPIGQRLTFSVREAIRSSSGYALAEGNKGFYRIAIVTIDSEKGALAGHGTIAAITFTMKNTNPFHDHDPQTWFPIYLSSQVLVAGSKVVDTQAKGILADLDAAVAELATE